jgi:bacterioferritin-associated ferredoxin
MQIDATGFQAASAMLPCFTPEELVPAAPVAEQEGVCTNTCQFAFDGECDDGGVGSVYSICEVGSDCSDCGPRANAIKP